MLVNLFKYYSLLFLVFISCSKLQTDNGEVNLPKLPKSYIANYTNQEIIIDGKDDEQAWKNNAWTDPFIDIEGLKIPKFETRMKMLWDNTNLYFFTKMNDTNIWGDLKQRDTVIFYNNDFEIFIDPDGDTHNYMEIEINALNTVWDLFLTKPYRNHPVVLNQWDIKGFQSNVHISGTINNALDIDQFWTVEIAIPWESLLESTNEKNPPEGKTWRLNFSRVEWDYELINNKYYRKKDIKGEILPEYNWVWSPQEVINMHEPERWGFVYFNRKPDAKDIPQFNYPKDAQLVLWMYEHYRKILRSDLKKTNLEMNFPIKESYEGNDLIIEQIKSPKGYLLKFKSPNTKITYFINQEGKLIIGK